MIPEYYMKTAKRIVTGEIVTGWLWQSKAHTNKYLIKCFPNDDDESIDYEVDPDTIEPVKVKPIKEYDDFYKRNKYKCPNCNNHIVTEADFCWKCRVALDWEGSITFDEGKYCSTCKNSSPVTDPGYGYAPILRCKLNNTLHEYSGTCGYYKHWREEL